jgi:protein-tyrosine phosphatase
VVNIPLFPELDPARMASRDRASVADLPSIYRGVLRASARNLARIVEVIAVSPSPLLLHCAAGKDRTGVATAVTLAAVGVRPEAIIADYLRTEESLDGLPERLAQGWSGSHQEASLRRLSAERPDLMLAPAAAIEAVLETLEEWPGAINGWLHDHGLSEARLAALRRRLTAPDPGAEAQR